MTESETFSQDAARREDRARNARSPMLLSTRVALTDWLADVEEWARERGVEPHEIRALWEEVTPTPPVEPGST